MSDYPSILYVEDDAQNRLVMEVLLQEEMGLTNVAIFEDSSNFIARVEQLPFKPDIILLDVHIEPLDGFEMLAQLRNHPQFKTCPTVAVTASVMNEEVSRLKNSGFDGAIAKPVPIDTFPNLIEKILEGQKIWRIR